MATYNKNSNGKIFKAALALLAVTVLVLILVLLCLDANRAKAKGGAGGSVENSHGTDPKTTPDNGPGNTDTPSGTGFVLPTPGGDGGPTGEPGPTSGSETEGPQVNYAALTEAELLALPVKMPEKTGGELVISEVMSSNTKYLPLSGKNYDWVEFANVSTREIDLSDYTFSDRQMKPEKFKFPSMKLAPGEFVIVYCSGNGNGMEASFKISSSGESLYLFKNGTLADYLDVPGDLGTDSSYARYGSAWLYSVKPSPGEANCAGRPKRLSKPAADIPSGCYPDALKVSLSGEGKIYYTLDGSAPSASSKLYVGPIEITKPTSVRAVCIRDNETGAEADYTYIVDKTASKLPIVNVAVNMDLLTGENGVFSDVSEPFKGTEAPILLTLIENGREMFSVPCGFKLNGNDSRKGAKQSFRLRFKSAYGPSKLNYKVFDDRDIDAFESLILRSGSEDFPRAMMRDEVCAAAVDGKTNLYVQAAKPVVLYIGGEYWGIYYIRERINEDYYEEHFGVDAETVELVESFMFVTSGDSKDYNDLVSFCKTNDLGVEANLNYVKQRIDLTGLMDWYLCRSYFGDHDIGNSRLFKSKAHDNIWRVTCFDLDWPFLESRTNEDTFTWYVNNTSDPIFKNLMKSALFRTMLQNRFEELSKGALSDANILAAVDKYETLLKDDIERDRLRWGYSLSSWKSQVNEIRNFINNGRMAVFKNNLQKYK